MTPDESFEKWRTEHNIHGLLIESCKMAYLAGTSATALRCVEIRSRFGRAHTYASENADEYRAFDNAMDQYAKAIVKEFGL